MELTDFSGRKGKPSIYISPTYVEVVAGQSHTITCNVSSISVITDVTWIKTTAVGNEIVNVVGVDGKFSGGTLSDPSLTINNIAKSDEGTYVCRATNCLGTTSSEYSVLICKDNPLSVHTINQGSTNYARLSLVVDIFQNILREIMRSNIAPEVLSMHIKKQYKKNPSVFNKMTKDEYVSLSTLKNGTYDSIDFTTLYKLMRSFLLIVDPTQGWGKQPTNADVTISDDVERLRFVRNKIVHCIKAYIDLIEMNNYFSNIVNITQRIDTNLGKKPDQGFTKEVLNFQTHCMDPEMQQKYCQALKDIEDIKEKFSVENVHFYYGKTFSKFIQDVKSETKSSVRKPICLVLGDINDDEKEMILNGLKNEINSGQVNIKFKQAVTGSLIIYIDILDSNLLSTEHELGHQIYNFLCRALQLTGFNMKTENEITVVLIKEEDDIEVEFSIESDNWETYDQEISLRSNNFCLELDVNTEIFYTEKKMQSEFGLFVKRVLGSNGKSNIESVSARLEPGYVVSGQRPIEDCSSFPLMVSDGDHNRLVPAVQFVTVTTTKDELCSDQSRFIVQCDIEFAMTSLTDDYLFVAAIDFGTTYSGYAFSSRCDFKKDPLKIITNQAWNGGKQRHLSLKTPTCLLLDDKEELVSFGYEAENKYSDIVIDCKQNEYIFFQHFKMQLYKNKQLKSEMMIEDVTGRPVPAMKVFGISIRALMNHLFLTFTKRGIEIEPKDIRWVLTVPAIWSDAAKQFMRKSANLAGIKDNQLLIALEPEAASIYCQYLPTEKLKGAERGFSMFEEGTQYMVVDNGGGTTDITVHEKLSNGRLKELCRASGGDCGGTSVDNAFYQIFVKLVGAPLLSAMKKEDPSAYLDIFREFDTVKRTVYTDKKDKVTMSIPRAILDDICKKHLKEDFKAVIQSSPYHDKIRLRYDKMIIDTKLIIDMFKQASGKIIELISDVLDKMKGSNLKMIVLVGGFSGCKIIQDNIKSFFPNYRVIVPEDAELAVLKGAVLFGHKPDYIMARIARYTYGVNVLDDFNPEIHEPGRCVVVNGKKKCWNFFYIYIKTGSVVKLGAKITKILHTTEPFQSRVPCSIFQSTIEHPQNADVEGCTQLGTLTIDIQDPSEELRDISVNMIFGNTELKVTAFDEMSGVECGTVLDLI